MITVEWEWTSDEDDPTPWQRKHTRHLFHPGCFVKDLPIRRLSRDVALPDDRCLVAVINDDALIDGSPPNRCIFNLTGGKALHPWPDNILALRQRPQDYAGSLYSSANLEEDLEPLKNYFLTYGQVSLPNPLRIVLAVHSLRSQRGSEYPPKYWTLGGDVEQKG